MYEDVDRCTSPASTISVEDDATIGHDISVLTAASVPSCEPRDFEDPQLNSLRDGSLSWLRVERLDTSTTHDDLLKLFYHHGAQDAFVVKVDTSRSSQRKKGYVSFPFAQMALLAIEKVHHFVPKGQSAPLHVETAFAADILMEVSPKQVQIFEPPKIPDTPSQLHAHLNLIETRQASEIAHELRRFDDPITICSFVIGVADQVSPLGRIRFATSLLMLFGSQWFLAGETQRRITIALAESETPSARLLLELLQVDRPAEAAAPAQSTSAASRHRIEESRGRTVYVSRIPASLRPSILSGFLRQWGTVNKVRLCSAKGEAGDKCRFAFVEYDCSAAARVICSSVYHNVCGYQLRIQPAKMPIQDTHPHDAVQGPGGIALRVCTFGYDDATQ